MNTIADHLARELSHEVVRTDPEVLESHRRDETPGLDAGMPAAVVFARSTDDVRAVVQTARAQGVPIVPRGAGSGLAGGANAIDGCIVLSLERMSSVLEVDPRNMVAVTQPGVITAELDRACRALGVWYPPDPASRAFSTIGGNVATNAGGLCCVKYGVTGDYVLGLEVVLADGSIARVGRRTRKGVAGYDLTRLFVGSEGTLGIVTEVTVRLRPAPLPASTLVASFPSLESAGSAIATIVAGLVPSLVEVMDRTTINAVEALKPFGLDRSAEALLVVQSDAPDQQAELDAVELVCKEARASFVVRSSDPSEAELLLEARRSAHAGLERLGATMLDDVAVPPAQIPVLLRLIQEIALRNRVIVGTFGHAGEGNMHPTIVYDSATQQDAAREAFEEILRAALSLGGTITGEHGVGALKRRLSRRRAGTGGAPPPARAQGCLRSRWDPQSWEEHLSALGKLLAARASHYGVVGASLDVVRSPRQAKRDKSPTMNPSRFFWVHTRALCGGERVEVNGHYSKHFEVLKALVDSGAA